MSAKDSHRNSCEHEYTVRAIGLRWLLAQLDPDGHYDTGIDDAVLMSQVASWLTGVAASGLVARIGDRSDVIAALQQELTEAEELDEL